MDSIPDNFKKSNLDTTTKKTSWVITLNVNAITDFDHFVSEVQSGVNISKYIIGNLETGKLNNKKHHHAVVILQKECTQSAVVKRFIKNYINLVHLEDYCCVPSAHYFNKDEHPIEKAIEYATKHGIMHQSANMESKLKRIEVVKKTRDTLITKFCEENDIPTDEYAVVKYEKCLQLKGESIAKELFPLVHNKTEGKSVRKQNVNDKWQDENMFTGDIFNIWIYGGAGLGKTTLVDVLYPGRYSKRKDTQYWEKYNYKNHTTSNNHMCVHFDEVCTIEDVLRFSASGKSPDTFKNMFCEAPFSIEIKHEAQEMTRFKVGIVTSNCSLEVITDKFTERINAANYNKTDPLFGIDALTLKEALLRRFTIIHINDLHNKLGTVCISVDKEGFGGVFMKNMLPDIIKERKELVVKYKGSTGLEKEEFYRLLDELKRKYRAMTIQELEKFRWVPFDRIEKWNEELDIEEDSLDKYLI